MHHKKTFNTDENQKPKPWWMSNWKWWKYPLEINFVRFKHSVGLFLFRNLN